MAVEENLNKSMYKLLILMLKYIPMLISLVYVLNTALSYFYMVQAEILNLVKGRIESTPEGKELLQRQLKIVKKLKGKIIQETNRERVRDNLTLSFCLYYKYFIYIDKSNLFTIL